MKDSVALEISQPVAREIRDALRALPAQPPVLRALEEEISLALVDLARARSGVVVASAKKGQ